MRLRISRQQFRLILRATVRASIKFLLIGILWQAMEFIFYGEIQPRIVDDFIGCFLFYYIYRNEQRHFWKY